MSTFEEVPQFEIIEALGRTLKGISSIALTYDVIVNQCEMWVVNCQSIDRYIRCCWQKSRYHEFGHAIVFQAVSNPLLSLINKNIQ